MNRDEVLDQVSRCGVVRLALFGSTVRDAARADSDSDIDSDIDSDSDILVSFSGPATSERYLGVHFLLEDLVGRPIDLVTGKVAS